MKLFKLSSAAAARSISGISSLPSNEDLIVPDSLHRYKHDSIRQSFPHDLVKLEGISFGYSGNPPERSLGSDNRLVVCVRQIFRVPRPFLSDYISDYLRDKNGQSFPGYSFLSTSKTMAIRKSSAHPRKAFNRI